MDRAVQHAKKAIQPSVESQEIDNIMALVQDSVREFRECVQRKRDKRELKTARNVQSTLYEVQATRRVGIDTKIEVRKLGDQIDGLARDNRKIYTNQEQSRAEIEKLRAALAAQNGLLTELVLRSPTPGIVIQSSPASVVPERSFLPGYHLIVALKVDHMVSARDLQRIIRQAGSVSQTDQAQAQQLLQLSRFSEWF
jgi:hypothetical protein